MNTKAAGLLGISIITAALISSLVRPPQTAADTKAQPLPRYQIVKMSENVVYLLDSQTGRTWYKFVSSNQGPAEWREDSGPRSEESK